MSIKLENVSYVYNPDNVFESTALKDINLEIKENEFIGLIGHTGSGKSTLVQMFNGLLKPTSGKVLVDGLDTNKGGKEINKVRQEVGLVFQYPEYQLFEETIERDIAFGPSNLDLPDEEINKRVRDAMDMVGLDYETMKDESPFDLSGGQKRRVAIAGVLAMKPRYLILDEPTAGLDPEGRDSILDQIKKLYKRDEELTVIIVSHSMEDVANFAKRVIVMDHGKLYMDDTPQEVYKHDEELSELGLGVPQITRLSRRLEAKGYKFSDTVLTVEDAIRELLMPENLEKLKALKGDDLGGDVNAN